LAVQTVAVVLAVPAVGAAPPGKRVAAQRAPASSSTSGSGGIPRAAAREGRLGQRRRRGVRSRIGRRERSGGWSGTVSTVSYRVALLTVSGGAHIGAGSLASAPAPTAITSAVATAAFAPARHAVPPLITPAVAHIASAFADDALVASRGSAHIVAALLRNI